MVDASNGRSTEVVESDGDTWAIVLPNLSNMWQILLAVGATSTHAQQRRWGCGAVVATTEVICRMRAAVQAEYASTALLEATTVVQAAKVVKDALVSRRRGHVAIWPWSNNKSAADMLWWRDLAKSKTDFMRVVLAEPELLAVAGEFHVAWCAAEHDTKSRAIISKINGKSHYKAHPAFT